MSAEIPESYKAGIARIEGFDVDTMADWLRSELHDRVRLLAGQEYDYPVQAIVNHHRYLSIEAQARMAEAVNRLVLAWKSAPTEWEVSAAQALLSLVAELPVSWAKPGLQAVARSRLLEGLPEALRIGVFGALAAISTNDDRRFWAAVAKERPDCAGMAFQVLARVAPDDALGLIRQLPDSGAVIGSVARKLPDLVSRFAPEVQPEKLAQVAQALALLPPASRDALKVSLEEAGFAPVEIPSQRAASQRSRFRQSIEQVTQNVSRDNDLRLAYA
jgi:hypothetical protein